MKFGLIFLAAIAATATAGNLRSPLLAQCRSKNGQVPPPTKCCAWKKGVDHELYVKPDGDHCCNQNIGMWMPTTVKKLANQYCKHTEYEQYKKVKRNLDEMASAAYKFKNTILGMEDVVRNGDAEFKKNYVQHEKVENEQEKKNDDKMKMLKDKEEEATEVKESYERTTLTLKRTIGDMFKKEKEFQEAWNVLLGVSKKARGDLNKALTNCANVEGKLASELREFSKCKFENEVAKKLVAEMTKNIEAEEVNVKAAATKVVEAEQKLADTKKTSDEEAKKLQGELEKAKGNLDELTQQKTKTETKLKFVQKKLDQAEEHFDKAEKKLEDVTKKNKDADKMVESANNDLKEAKELSFLEFSPLKAVGNMVKTAATIVKGWWNKDCDEACQQLKAYSSSEYIRKSAEDAAVKGKPETLSKVFGDQLNKMKDTLDALQAKVARHKVLHDHDVNLHKEIMGELEKEFADIKKALADLGVEIAKMETARRALDKIVTILSNRLQSMILAQADKISTEERRIARTEKETQAMITRMELAEAKLKKIATQNKECKEGVAALKKDAKEKEKEVAILKRATEILAEDLTKADEKTQELVDRAAAHKAKMAAEIKNVENEAQETEAAVNELSEDIDSVWNKKKAVDAQTDNLNAKSDAQQEEIKQKEKQADATKKKADEIIEDKLMRL